MAEPPAEGAGAAERIGGRYRVERRLGRGGMGEVLQVWDEAEARWLALKRLRPDARSERLQELFEREYDTLARLDHPGIVRVHDHGVSADGAAFYTMELLESDPLLNGSLHMELAQLAIRRRDRTSYERHREQVEASFAATENPELMGRYERLVEESRALSRRTRRGPRP